jgi:carbonic anhydrase
VTAGGAILVVAIPFQLSEDGITAELLAGVIVNLSKVSKPGTVTETGALHFKELIKAVETHPLFQYSGSLTTPPCKEGVTFLVMEEPMALNVRTYNNLKAIIKFNARYSQNAPGEANLLDIAAKLAQENEGVHPD